MENKRVLIACPVHNREWILPMYLQHMHELDYDKKLIDIYWLVNNCKDKSEKLLRDFKKKHEAEYNSITIEVYNNRKVPDDSRLRHVRRGHIYYWLAELRNKLLDKCVELDCDYLLSSDSDILMRYDTITGLMRHNNAITSGLILNKYDQTPDRKVYSNILNFDKSNGVAKHIQNARLRNIPSIPDGKVLPVDFTGACILIRKDVCNNVRYSYFKQGEDGGFCIDAKKKGYQILCDLSIFNVHIMNKKWVERLYTLDCVNYLKTGDWGYSKND